MRRSTSACLLACLAFSLAVGCGSSSPPRGTAPAARAVAVTPTTPAPPAPAASAPRRIVAGFDCAAPEEPTPPPSPASRWDVEEPPLRAEDAMCAAEPKTLEAAARAVVCGPPAVARTRGPAWDHTTPPAHLDLVARRYALTPDERARLFKDGLVVPERLAYPDYTSAFEDVHRSQLPVYVSADAILHAVYASHDKLLAGVEANAFVPAVEHALEAMHEDLAATPKRYGTSTARDLDLYLTVARLLATPFEDGDVHAPRSALGQDTEAKRLAHLATRAGGTVTLSIFGRERVVDFGAFRPRGHYAPEWAQNNPGRADLSRFYRTAMWLSRLELNLVSRSSRSSAPTLDPRETPREVALALALADVAKRTEALADVEKIDRAWAAFAGKREDVPVRALSELAEKAGVASPDDPDAPRKIASAIGDGYRRTARTHYQVEGTAELPAILTLLGPRVPADSSATRGLVHGEVPNRREIPGAEMAFVLGQDRAEKHLAKDLAAFPSLRAAMVKSRDDVARATGDLSKSADLYTAWLGAVAGLAKRPAGHMASFAETEAFADMRVASTVAGYAQIRHNHVLLVPMTQDEGGCEIPDGWVDPVPATFAALRVYAKRAADALRPFGEEHAASLGELDRTLQVLETIAARELAGEPLRDEDRRFLAMVVQEPRWSHSAYGPSTRRERGWYFGLFAYDAAREDARLVADYFGSVHDGRVDYAGVSGVAMGLFVIDVGGAPRLAVGPVTRAFQAKGPMAPRWSDDDVDRITRDEPWAASYLARTPKLPSLTVTTKGSEGDELTFEVASAEAAGPVTLALLDHHNVEVASVTHEVRGAPGRPAKVTFTFTDPRPSAEVAKFGLEGLRIGTASGAVFDTSAAYGLGVVDTRWQVKGGVVKREDVYASGPRPTGRGRRL